jgi:hypothetical protein
VSRRTLPSVSRRARLGLLLSAGAATAAVAIPASASANQYAYVWAKTATLYDCCNAEVDLARVNVTSGQVDNPWRTWGQLRTGGSGLNWAPSVASQSLGTPMAVSGNYIYFSNYYDSAVGRIDRTTGAIQRDWTPFGFSNGDVAYSIAVKDDYIYMGTFNGFIARVKTDGTDFNGTYIVAESNFEYIPSLRIVGSTAYWIAQNPSTSEGTLRKCTITACTPTTIATNLGPLAEQGFGIAGGYALVPGQSAFKRVDLTTGTVDSSWLAGPAAAACYFTSADGDGNFFYTSQSGCTGSDSVVAKVSATSNAPGQDATVVGTIWSTRGGDSLVSNVVVAPPVAVPPAITGVSPANGTTAGGTTVTITGTNLTGATAVTFGGTAATSFTVDSPTQITAVTPARSAGAADVVVTTPDGTDTEAGAFLYQAPAPPAPPATPAAGNTQAPTSAWVPPTGPEDKAILINDARVDLAAPPAVTSQGNDTTVVTNMTVDEVGRYTVMYVAPKRVGNAIGEMASATERVSFAKGTVINKRKLKRKYTAVTFTTTKQGAQVTMRALLKRAKGRKLTLRVIYKAADGTLKESRIKS